MYVVTIFLTDDTNNLDRDTTRNGQHMHLPIGEPNKVVKWFEYLYVDAPGRCV